LAAMTEPGVVAFDHGILHGRWNSGPAALLLLANLSAAAQARPNDLSWGDPIWGGTPPATLPPWSVYAAIGAAP